MKCISVVTMRNVGNELKTPYHSALTQPSQGPVTGCFSGSSAPMVVTQTVCRFRKSFKWRSKEVLNDNRVHYKSNLANALTSNVNYNSKILFLFSLRHKVSENILDILYTEKK